MTLPGPNRRTTSRASRSSGGLDVGGGGGHCLGGWRVVSAVAFLPNRCLPDGLSGSGGSVRELSGWGTAFGTPEQWRRDLFRTGCFRSFPGMAIDGCFGGSGSGSGVLSGFWLAGGHVASVQRRWGGWPRMWLPWIGNGLESWQESTARSQGARKQGALGRGAELAIGSLLLANPGRTAHPIRGTFRLRRSERRLCA